MSLQDYGTLAWSISAGRKKVKMNKRSRNGVREWWRDGAMETGAVGRNDNRVGAIKSPQSAGMPRTYSPSKVIHRWREEPLFSPSQPTVNNFGGDRKMLGEQLRVLLNREAEHAGPGRRIAHSSVTTLFWRVSLRCPAPCRKGILRTFRLQVQTCQRRTSISASIRQGPRARHVNNHKLKL